MAGQDNHQRWERWQTELWDHIFQATQDVVLLADSLEQGVGEAVVKQFLVKASMQVGAELVRANASDNQGEFVGHVKAARLQAIETDYWLRLAYALQQKRNVQHDVSVLITRYATIIDLLLKRVEHIRREPNSLKRHTKGPVVR